MRRGRAFFFLTFSKMMTFSWAVCMVAMDRLSPCFRRFSSRVSCEFCPTREKKRGIHSNSGVSESLWEKVWYNLKCLKRHALQCIKSLKMGSCENKKKYKVRLKSELSHPWYIIYMVLVWYFSKKAIWSKHLPMQYYSCNRIKSKLSLHFFLPRNTHSPAQPWGPPSWICLSAPLPAGSASWSAPGPGTSCCWALWCTSPSRHPTLLPEGSSSVNKQTNKKTRLSWSIETTSDK